MLSMNKIKSKYIYKYLLNIFTYEKSSIKSENRLKHNKNASIFSSIRFGRKHKYAFTDAHKLTQEQSS